MRPSIGLRIEAFDLDDPYLSDLRRDEVPRQAHQIRTLELVPREKPHEDAPLLLDDAVRLGFDRADAVFVQVLEGEVHPRPVVVDRPAGDERVERPIDDADQNVQGGVVTHDIEAPLPVQDAADRRAGRWDCSFHGVPDGVAVLAQLDDTCRGTAPPPPPSPPAHRTPPPPPPPPAPPPGGGFAALGREHHDS